MSPRANRKRLSATPFPYSLQSTFCFIQSFFLSQKKNNPLTRCSTFYRGEAKQPSRQKINPVCGIAQDMLFYYVGVIRCGSWQLFHSQDYPRHGPATVVLWEKQTKACNIFYHPHDHHARACWSLFVVLFCFTYPYPPPAVRLQWTNEKLIFSLNILTAFYELNHRKSCSSPNGSQPPVLGDKSDRAFWFKVLISVHSPPGRRQRNIASHIPPKQYPADEMCMWPSLGVIYSKLVRGENS